MITSFFHLLFVFAPPTIASVDIVRKLKSISANWIFQGFPTLKQNKFWGIGLWSRGYYIGTAGTVSAEIYSKSEVCVMLL